MNGEVDDPDGVDERVAGAADGGGQTGWASASYKEARLHLLKRDF
jgi:hypothetical protein